VFFITSKLKIELKWQLTFTFFAAISFITFAEIGEYILDRLFDWKLQGVYQYPPGEWNPTASNIKELMSPIKDTMIDISLGVLGALLYCISVFKIKKEKKINKK